MKPLPQMSRRGFACTNRQMSLSGEVYELRRINLGQESDIVAVLIADDIVLVRLLCLCENVGIRCAVFFYAVFDPIGLTRKAGALSPVGFDGPASVSIVSDRSTLQKLGKLVIHSLSLENSSLFTLIA